MRIERLEKGPFTAIGKEGSAADGPDFIFTCPKTGKTYMCFPIRKL